jgi:hypothetical protein
MTTGQSKSIHTCYETRQRNEVSERFIKFLIVKISEVDIRRLALRRGFAGSDFI